MRSTAACTLRHWLILTVVTLLAACGGQSGNGAPTPAEETPPSAAGQITRATPAPSTAAEAPAVTPEIAAPAVQESDVELPADGGEQLKLASAASPAEQKNWRFKEGEHFTVLTAAQGTTGAPGKIEVAEVFWYGCPHCYQFDPQVHEWGRKLPADIGFIKLPVMWNPTNQIHARVFYTAQALGKLEAMHTPIFREMHVEKKMLTDEGEIQAFFGRFNVSSADFGKTFRSFAVESQLKRAKDLTERYQIRSVPVLIVNGKYSVGGPGVRNYDDMLAVAGELIERERQR